MIGNVMKGRFNVKKYTQYHGSFCLRFGMTVVLMALSLSGAARAEEGGESSFQVHSISEDSFIKVPAESNPHGPVNFAPIDLGAGWMAAGVHRFEKNETWIRDWVYWYREFVYVIRGHGKISISPPPYTATETRALKAGDVFSISPSMKVSFEAVGDETFEIVWAIPD
jgi:hypothetical protein